jgi:hypothetical protein
METFSNKYSLSICKGVWLLLVISGLLLITFTFVYTGRQKYNADSKGIQARNAIIRTLGIASLAISYECSSTRNPLEGLCGSMSDIPGAYLYHTDCDLVEPSLFPPETRYRIEVNRK